MSTASFLRSSTVFTALSSSSDNRRRRWAEERETIPARVKWTGGPNDVGILRLHFPEYSQDDEKLEPISWNEFFEEFDRKKLALLVEDRMPDGQRSNFNKIISRSTVEDFVRRSKSGSGRRAA